MDVFDFEPADMLADRASSAKLLGEDERVVLGWLNKVVVESNEGEDVGRESRAAKT